MGGTSDTNEDDSNMEETRDEYFWSGFRLSKFRKEVMKLAVANFPDEYNFKTKSLGEKSKLYFKKEWNSSLLGVNYLQQIIYILL